MFISGRAPRRRDLLTCLAAPALVGLGGCANNTEPDATGYVRLGPASGQLAAAMPQAVKQELATNPAFAGHPGTGIFEATSRDEGFLDRNLIYRQAVVDDGPALRHTSVLVTRLHDLAGYDAFISFANLLQFAFVYQRVRLSNAQDAVQAVLPVSDPSLLHMTTAISNVSGKLFPLRQGNQLAFSLQRTAMDQNLNLSGTSSARNARFTVLETMSQETVWGRIAIGAMPVECRNFLLEEPAFLAGDHAVIENINGGKILYSHVLGLPVLYQAPGAASWTTAAPFGTATERRPRLRGEHILLNPVGEARLREARQGADVRLADFAMRGAQTPAAARARARPMLSRGYDLWRSGDYAGAWPELVEGLRLDFSNGPGNYYLADSLVRQAGPRPSVRALAADRLARHHYRLAAGLAPETPEGRESRARITSQRTS